MDTTLTQERVRWSTERGFWRNESLDTYLDRWATRRPDKTAIVDGRTRSTYAELARLVERVAHGLRAHGVESGSVISCQLPNWNECIVLFLAAARLGAVVNPIPPTYRASELRFMLGLLESRVVVIPEVFRGFRYTEMLAGLRRDVPAVEHVFVARGEPRRGCTRGPPSRTPRGSRARGGARSRVAIRIAFTRWSSPRGPRASPRA